MADLSTVIDQYLADRRAKGAASGTIRNDKYILRLLLADVGNIQSRNLRVQHVDVFWSRRATWGDGTFNMARATLGAFFEWCRHRGHLGREVDPLAGTRNRRVVPRDRCIIPQSQWESFLEGNSPRTRMILALGLYLFLRKSEIEGLRWQDLNMDTKEIDAFRQKTRTMDTLPICEELEHEIRRWRLAYAAKVGQQPLPSWYVIPALKRAGTGRSRPGTKGFTTHVEQEWVPTRRADLSRVLRNALLQSGYYRPHEGGHTLRRSGAIALYNQLSSVGHDRAIRICQAMLGHASVQTTEIYLRLDLDRKVRNDLLSGRRMFPEADAGSVVEFGKAVEARGQAHP